jgi:insulysin
LDIIREITQLTLREKKFKLYKDLLLREYQNGSMDMPVLQAYELLNSVLKKDFFTDKAKATAIRKITFDQFQDFYQHVFKQTYIEGTMYGNMNAEQAQELASQFLATLNSQPYPKEEQPKEEIIVLPKDQGPFLIETKSKVQGNAAVLAVALGRSELKERAVQQVLMQAMKGPFFSTLRTKQQTGYIVRSYAEELEQHLFNTFAVQSNTHEGRDLIARFELFIEGFLQELGKTEVTREQFETFKKTFLTTLRQPPQSMTELTALLNKLAFTYEGDFDRIEKRIRSFEELTYEEFLTISRQMLGKNNKQRIAIILTGSTPEETLKYKKLGTPAQLKELSTYEPASQD